MKKGSLNDGVQNGIQVITALEFPETQCLGLKKTVYPIRLGLTFYNRFFLFGFLVRPRPHDQGSLCPHPAFCTHPLPCTHPVFFWCQSRTAIAFPSLLQLRYPVKCCAANAEGGGGEDARGRLLSSRSNIFEVGCQGACKI